MSSYGKMMMNYRILYNVIFLSTQTRAKDKCKDMFKLGFH